MTTRSSAFTPARARTRWVSARVWVIIVLFLLVSGMAAPVLSLLQEVTGLNPNVVELTQFATAAGALVTWLVWRKQLAFPPVRVRGWMRPLLTVLVLAFIVALLLLIAEIAESHLWPLLRPSTVGAPFVLVLAAQLVGAAGEEIGWRGLVQPLLETRMRLLPAALITGLFFGLGHLYVISVGIGVFALFMVSAIGMSLMLAVVTAGRSIWQRVALASVLHWLVNIVFLVGFSGGDESALWIANTAIATGLAGIGCVLYARSRRVL